MRLNWPLPFNAVGPKTAVSMGRRNAGLFGSSDGLQRAVASRPLSGQPGRLDAAGAELATLSDRFSWEWMPITGRGVQDVAVGPDPLGDVVHGEPAAR